MPVILSGSKLLVTALALWAGSASPSLASAISYSLQFAENLDVLRHPDNPNVADNAAFKSQHTLMLERTNPFVELMNTSDDDAFITRFTMTVGDTSKNFDWSRVVETSPGVTFSLEMPDAIAGGLHTDLLVINFQGFGKGDFVRFRVGLAPDDSGRSAIMDYRNVFFRMNGGADTSGNSLVEVSFTRGNDTTVLQEELPNFVNNNRFTSTDLELLTTYCGMDSVVPFGSQGSGEIIPIPEPGSLVLSCLGMAGLVACCRRRQWRRHL